MLLRFLTGLPAVALQSALAVPVEATRRIPRRPQMRRGWPLSL